MPPPSRILLLRPGALGDVLLAFPALAWLRHVCPNTRLTFVARADVLPLARAVGLADATSAFDDPVWGALWASEPATAKLRVALDGAEALVAWLRDADGAVARALGAAGMAHVVVAPGQPPDGAREHVARYLVRTLAPLGVGEPPRTLAGLAALLPVMTTLANSPATAATWQALGLAGARVVALHPGSGGAAKCWPAERFAVVAARLRQAGFVTLVIEGPADGVPVAQLLAACAHGNEDTPPVMRGLSVEALAGVLACCAAYLGNDSGVSHLAALAGCPTLDLFGPTDPARWAPVGRRVFTLRGPRGMMDEIEAEDAWDAMQRLL